MPKQTKNPWSFGELQMFCYWIEFKVTKALLGSIQVQGI